MNETTVTKTLKFPPETLDLLDFIERQVDQKTLRGETTSFMNEVRICIRHRQLALMPAAERDELLRRLAIGVQKGREDKKGVSTQTDLDLS